MHIVSSSDLGFSVSLFPYGETRSRHTVAQAFQPMTTQPGKAVLPDSAHVPYLRVYKFKTSEPPGDLKVFEGAWHWVSNGGPDGKGCMETDTELFGLEFQLPPGDRALLGTDFARAMPPAPANGFSVLFGWADYSSVAYFSGIGPIYRHPEGVWIMGKHNITAHWIDSNLPVGRQGLYLYEGVKTTRLRLYVRGRHRFDGITLEELDPSKLPDISQYTAALEKIEPAKRKGKVLLPELPSLRPPQPVCVDFYEGQAAKAKE